MTTQIETIPWRNGYKWTVNECLRLEREFDLLQLSVPEMANLHNRTNNAIMFKLQDEGLDTYNNLYFKTYGFEQCDDQDLCDEQDSDYESEPDSDVDEEYVDLGQPENQHYLLQHIKNLQTQINIIKSYFTQTKTQTKTIYEEPFSY
jgi:hypothetical protein